MPVKDKIRVLVVDDHELICQGIIHAVEGEPDILVVGAIGNASMVIESVEKEKPFIVLMDIQLGGGEKDGISLAEEIKKNFPQIKVILISMHEDEEYIERAISAMVDGYILKDIHKETFVKAIRVVAHGDTFMDSRITRRLMRQYTSLKEDKQQKQLRASLSDKALSPREKEVVVELAHGNSNKEIADKLCISEQTVKTHVYNVFRKLEVGNRIELTLYAVRNGLIEASASIK